MNAVPEIFDRTLARQRLRRALAIGPEPFILDRAVEDLADRLAPIRRDFADLLDFGTPGRQAHRLLTRLPGVRSVLRVTEDIGQDEADTRLADLENPQLGAETCDLIVSLLALHHVNDLPGVLMQLRRALRPDGLFIGALMGGETLNELRAALIEAEIETTGGAAPRVSPFADVRSLGQLLQRAGFALPVADSECLKVRYSSPLHLMRDLRAMGAGNILKDRSRKPLGRETLRRAVEIYQQTFGEADGKVRATFDIIWLSGWAPHESQQKPLRPGSAKMRLADALKAAIPSDTDEGSTTP